MDSLKRLYRKIVPLSVRKIIGELRNKRRNRALTERSSKVRDWLESRKEFLTEDEKVVYEYLKINPDKIVPVFPYDYAKKYDINEIKVFRDEKNGLPYVIHSGKRLYYKRSMSDTDVARNYFGEGCITQDKDSPHLYLEDGLFSTLNGVIADVGCAEANFALDVVEGAEKVFLFEGTPEWHEALEATFEPWKDKVFIVKKWLGEETNAQSISLDDFFAEQRVDLIKMDIEGAEKSALLGGRKILSRDNPELIICTYHKWDDARVFKNFLEKYPYKLSHTKGYMIFIWDEDFDPPYLRRGVLRAARDTNPCNSNNKIAPPPERPTTHFF